MRKIKFRGKRARDKEWVYGYLADSDIICEGAAHDDCYNWFLDKAIEVIPKTICQFTGLYDKNGKEIYEGDMLKCLQNNKVYLVIFENGGYKLKPIKKHFILPVSILKHIPFEIIGDVYDNTTIKEI